MSAYVNIRKALELFKNRPTSLRIGITSEQAAHEISLLTSVAEEFEAIGTQLAKEGNAGTDVNILALIQKGKHEILSTALATDFKEKYQDQIWSYRTFENLKKFLQAVFGSSLTKRELIMNARKKLESAHRFTNENETFTIFHGRLVAMAKPIKDNKSDETASCFIEDAFYRNLSPQHKLFLTENGYTEKSLAEIVEFLDSRRKHQKQVSVNNLGLSEITELKKQIESLTLQNQQIFNLLSTPSNLTTQDPEMPLLVNKIETKSSINQGDSKLKREKFARQPGVGVSGNSRRQQDRCWQCGLLGHLRSDCPRTCRSICHNCGKRGHLQIVCRSSKNLQ